MMEKGDAPANSSVLLSRKLPDETFVLGETLLVVSCERGKLIGSRFINIQGRGEI